MEFEIQRGLKILKTLGFTITNVVTEKESAEYSACQFMVGNSKMLFRKAKITPTKNGQFVTLWKREGNNPIAPFSVADEITTVVISVEKDGQYGQFLFPASVLYSQKIFTANGKEGKRAFRLYPRWDIPESKQAAKTQQWQLQYFIEIKNDSFFDAKEAKKLFEIE